jgi:hypothetical protein
MKKEYLFFLVMVLAAAVITGATIGLISNFHYIEKQVQENQSAIETPQQQASVPSDEPDNPIKSETVNSDSKDNINTNNEVKTVAVVRPATSSTEQGYLVLSGEEKQQIVDMLVSLGATKNGDYSTFIRNFQRAKSLPPTGSLDSLTLNAIINEVTRQRAAQMANG